MSAGKAKLDAVVARIRQHRAKDRLIAETLGNVAQQEPALYPPPPPKKVALAITQVLYLEDDPIIGRAMAVASLLPVIALVSLIVWIVARRELRAIVMLLGAIANGVLCTLLKRLCQQPRPDGAWQTDYGMPSNHTQCVAFLVAYCLSFLWRGSTTIVHGRLWKPLLSLVATLALAAVGTSRVYLGEHTRGQVGAGLLIGLVAGFACERAYVSMLPALRPWLEAWPCRYFYVRETARVRDVMRREFDFHRSSGDRDRAADVERWR